MTEEQIEQIEPKEDFTTMQIPRSMLDQLKALGKIGMKPYEVVDLMIPIYKKMKETEIRLRIEDGKKVLDEYLDSDDSL